MNFIRLLPFRLFGPRLRLLGQDSLFQLLYVDLPEVPLIDVDIHLLFSILQRTSLYQAGASSHMIP